MYTIQGGLTYKPTIEQVRTNYYNEIKKFISIPYTFEGFDTNGQIYDRMSSKNAKRLYNVYKKAETLFTRYAYI